jgi:hypothetical protein
LGCPCSNPIYHSTQFGVIWRLPSAKPNYWTLTELKRAQLHSRIQHLEGYLLAFRFETSRGDSTHPIYSLASSSEYLEVFGIRAELLRVFSVPAGRSSSNLGVWHFIQPRSHLVLIYCSSWPLEVCIFYFRS